MITVFTVRRAKERRERIVLELRPRIFTFLRNILMSKDGYSDVEIRNLYIENFGPIKKKTYMSLIPTLEDVVKQDKHRLDSLNYRNVISGLKIDSHLEKRLDFSNTRIRLKAFQSLSRLDLTISDSKILPHTYARNASLRKESRASYVGVSNNDPFKFFDQDNEMNQWDQISLLSQFVLHHSDNLPNFSKWMKYSKDNGQIIFFIKLVAHFNQATSVSTVIEFLGHADHLVRKEAIITLGKMRVKDTESHLIKIYFTQPFVCQTAIIEAISYISSYRQIGFLKNAWEMASSHELKKLVAEVIFLYGKGGKALITELSARETGFNKLVLEHVQNPLIPTMLKSYHANNKKVVHSSAEEVVANEVPDTASPAEA